MEERREEYIVYQNEITVDAPQNDHQLDKCRDILQWPLEETIVFSGDTVI